MAKGNILIVDDEKKIVSLVRTYLEREGYQVSEAYDGRLALEAFKRESPNLIILDVMLPGLDGLEVCREIRRSSEVPIIMLTARDEDTDKLVGLELGAGNKFGKNVRRKIDGTGNDLNNVITGNVAAHIGRTGTGRRTF